MTFYFNEAHYVQSAENLVYKLYSMEVDRDFAALINLELVGGMSETVWLLAHDFPEDAQWETATQNLYTEGMIEALEESGFQSILDLPEELQCVIAGYYSNGKYDEYRG